jgi:putative flippase GtrA
MRTFLKAQAASITASAVDFVTTVFLKEILRTPYLAASVLGTITGGVVNFLMGRNWVFDAGGKAVHKQSIKYLLVWCGNLLLNAAGVFLFTKYMGCQYIVSKIITSVLVGVFYNYFLQKRFVFK